MAGGGHGADPGLTGWQKTFDTTTYRGRLHCGYASILFWTSVGLAIKFWPKKKKAIEAK